MAESMKSLFRRGAISAKQMGRMSKPAILSQTRAQKAKMAAFDGKGMRDEGQAHGRGVPEVSIDEINERAVQDKGGGFGTAGRRGPPTKAGRAGAERQPQDGQIDDGAMQKPNWPKAGTRVSGKEAGRKVGITGGKGKSAPSQYGGPSSRAYG
jgi:hypothetical protein